MKITFEPKEKVVATYLNHRVVTDEPIEQGGEDSALNPFQTFLTAIGTCGGVFMKMFYKKYNLSLDGAYLNQDCEFDDHGMLNKVVITVHVGNSFPMDKQNALIANLKVCKVKKHLNPDIIFEYKIEQ
ncbi:MAG: OsmC family protein [Bacteroidales bacterium]|jgi:ribosomal protein S12 methylthiotransferase accessory factor|nr:OsmC family protein [Bacteroidales bacterium]